MDHTNAKLPPYKRMIKLAIAAEPNRKGASLIRIYKYIEQHWRLGPNKRTFIKNAIRRQMETGDIVQNGARYRAKTKPIRRAKRAAKRNPVVAIAKSNSTRKPKTAPKKKAVPGTSVSQLVWFWQYYDNGWMNYHPDASTIVEAVYQDYLRNPGCTDVRSVTSGDWNYLVDFKLMQQQNIQHENHTIRKIRRAQIPIGDAVFRKHFDI
jgi:WWE domain/linker histone H1 and H5 family